MRRVGIKVLQDENLTGKVLSHAIANPVYELPKCDQAAVRGNIYVHHHHPSPLDRDIPLAMLERDPGGGLTRR